MPDKPTFDPRYHLLNSSPQSRSTTSASVLTSTSTASSSSRSESRNIRWMNGLASNSTLRNSNEHDLEIAYRLQQQFNDEKRKAEEDDLEFAKRMQNEEQTSTSEKKEKSYNTTYGNIDDEEVEKTTLQCNLVPEEITEPFSCNYGRADNAEKLRRSLESTSLSDCNDQFFGSPFAALSNDFDNDTADGLFSSYKNKEENESLALAKMLEMEEQEKAVAELKLIDDCTRREKVEDEDRKMALRMQEMEETGLGATSDIPPHMAASDETDEEEYMRQMMIQVQEKEDEELARNFQMQEDAADTGNDTQSDEDIDALAAILHESLTPPASTPSPVPPSLTGNELESSPRPKSPLPIETKKNEESIYIDDSIPHNHKTDEIEDKKPPAKAKAKAKAKVAPTNIKTKEIKNNKPKFSSKSPIRATKKKKRTLLSRFLPGKSKNDESPSSNQNQNSIPYDPPSLSPSLTPPLTAKVKPVANTTQTRSRRKRECVPSRNPAECDVCGKIAMHFLVALEKKYHLDCFTCMGCSEVIKPTDAFAFTTNEDGEKFPLHQKCHAELFGMKCTICKETIPYNEDGMVTYVKHPFFSMEQMCPKHANNPGRRCTGCNRFEPDGARFTDLHDGDRCLCNSCCRTVIVDSDDAKPLWKNVMSFFGDNLGITIWKGLREVPVLIVGYETLNESLHLSVHNASTQIVTRGLCLSEHQPGKRIELANMRFDKENGNFMHHGNIEHNGFTYFQLPDESKTNQHSSVTAILCLSGLPSDLAASVLAHEATHAWFKLHPGFDIKKPIPLMVEEGCCQLVANLLLSDGLEPANTETCDNGPSDESLRQYFKFIIETDENEIYGTGFRLAAKAYAKIGIQALLSHVAMYRGFPEV